MDEEPGPSREKSDKSDEKPTIDPELDITSDKFNPLRAIYDKSFTVPVSKAIVFDNLSSLEATIKRLGSITEHKFKRLSSKNRPKVKVCDEAATLVRRFEPHQLMVKGTGPKQRHQRNIIQKLKEGYDGPLGQLKKYMDNRQRVKIFIRRKTGIRGFVSGLIEAFDKHWNIALIDVIESWKRRKFKYTKNQDCFGEPQDMSSRLKMLNIKLPRVIVKSVDRMRVQCTRKIPQIMVRGEQISHVVLDVGFK